MVWLNELWNHDLAKFGIDDKIKRNEPHEQEEVRKDTKKPNLFRVFRSDVILGTSRIFFNEFEVKESEDES